MLREYLEGYTVHAQILYIDSRCCEVNERCLLLNLLKLVIDSTSFRTFEENIKLSAILYQHTFRKSVKFSLWYSYS